MKRQRPLLLMILVVYIFAPTLFSWVTHPEASWYRPYLIWLLVVAAAFLLQVKTSSPNSLSAKTRKK